MREKLTLTKVGNQEYPLLFNAQAYLDFEERYGEGFSVKDLFCGPDIYDTDKPNEKEQKEIEIKKARAFTKRELFWLVPTLAKQGLAQVKEEKGEAVDPPTEEYVSVHMTARQIPFVMSAVFVAITLGMQTEHEKGNNEEVDVVLEELESKNAEGGAD